MRPGLLIATLVLVLAGCSSPAGERTGGRGTAPTTGPSPEDAAPSAGPSGTTAPSTPVPTTATPTTPPEPTTADPVIDRVPREQWDAIVEAGMYRQGCPVGRSELRRLQVNHWDWQGEVRRGELVAHRDVAPSLSRVFTRLFDERFPIRRMQSVEAYDGDSDASLRDDNTAAYNCRRPDQTNAPVSESPHAHGRAIDINPRENPWRDPRCQPCWSPTGRFAERTEGKGKILDGGLVVRVMEREGWIWQNIAVPDYMHFDTGYPSRPWSSPRDGE